MGPPLKESIKKSLQSRLKMVRNRLVTKKNIFTGKWPAITYNRKVINLPRFNKYRRESATKVSFNKTNMPLNNQRYLVSQGNAVNQSWLTRQAAYIRSLSDYDFQTLAAFTVQSHKWIGRFMRTGNFPNQYRSSGTSHMVEPLAVQMQKLTGKPDASVYTNRNKALQIKAMELYARDLHRIIQNAPPVPATMYVYRGVNDDVFKGETGSIHHTKGFVSTAYMLKTAAIYGAPRGYNHHFNIHRIKVLRGSHVIAAAMVNQWNKEGENEILINSNSRYIVRARRIARRIVYQGNYRTESEDARITDVTLLP